MFDFPKSLLPQYLKLLETRSVPAASFAECIKWSRYFLDYCEKYPASIPLAEQLPLFIEKLKAKKQSELQCRQAAYAVSVFIELQKNEASAKQSSDVDEHKPLAAYNPPQEPLNVPKRYGSQYSEAGYQEKSDSPEWDSVLACMADEIKVRHYSRKTLNHTHTGHPSHSDPAWSFKPENDDDLHPLRTGADDQGSKKSAGFLIQRTQKLICNN